MLWLEIKLFLRIPCFVGFSATIEVVKYFSWKRNQNKHYIYKIRTKIPSISTHVDKKMGSRGLLFRKSTIYIWLYIYN